MKRYMFSSLGGVLIIGFLILGWTVKYGPGADARPVIVSEYYEVRGTEIEEIVTDKVHIQGCPYMLAIAKVSHHIDGNEKALEQCSHCSGVSKDCGSCDYSDMLDTTGSDKNNCTGGCIEKNKMISNEENSDCEKYKECRIVP